MNEVTINQTYLFLIFILNGILIGIVFDIFRILRKSFHTSNLVTYIEDALFWIISALSVMYNLFVFNKGEIRGYIFIGLFLGIALYMLFFSKTIIKVSVKIVVFLKEVVYSILKVITYPLKLCFKLLKQILAKITINFKKKSSNLTNNRKVWDKFKIKAKCRKKLEN